MSASYRSKPSEVWANNLEALGNTTFLLVCRHGPAVFSVKSGASGEVNKVTLGNPHKCTCKQEFCLHSLFCLTKVLRLPKTHPFCYQVGLTDNEMTQVLDGSCVTQPKRMSTRECMKPSPPTILPSSPVDAAAVGDPGKVPRIAVEPGDTCPICYGEMEVEMLGLTWCRSGCGQNIHGECMISYIDFQISNRKPIACPMCRDQDFSIPVIKRDIQSGKAALRKKSKNKDKEPVMTLPIQCSSCKCMLRSGVFFRCLECSHHLKKASTSVTNSLLSAALNQRLPQDFCMQCFSNISNNIHMHHHFVSSDTAIQNVDDVIWSVAQHPQTGGQEDNEARKAAREQILSTIRNRELTMDDYEMLLALDATPTQATLASVCISSLPLYNHSESSSQGEGSRLLCWCCDRRSAVHVNATTELYANIRVLPCGHLAHDKCMNDELEIFLSNEEACNTISDYRCSHIDCGSILFPGLKRHKKKKRTSAEAATAEASASEKNSGDANTGGAAGLQSMSQGNSLTFGLVGSALGSTSSVSNTAGSGAVTSGGAVVRPRRSSVERDGSSTTISQVTSRNNGSLQDMFVGIGSSGNGDGRVNNRSPSPSGGLVLGSTRRTHGLDGGGSISGRNTAEISRHAANTDMSAAVVLTSRSLSAGGGGGGESVTVRNRRASSEGIDPLVYRTVNHDYSLPAAAGEGGNPMGALRLKRPPRQKRDLRTTGAGGPADLTFAQSLLTVNAITAGTTNVNTDPMITGMSNEDGSVVGGGTFSALAPPQPPTPKDPSVSSKNKVSAILSRRLRNTDASIVGGGMNGEESPSFDDLAITNSGTGYVRQESNGGGGSSTVPPRRSPLVVLPSTNSGRLRGAGGGAAVAANVVTEGETASTRPQRAGSAVEGLTEPDVLSNLLSINSTATLHPSNSTGNLQLQSHGSTSSLNSRFNEIKTKPPVKGKIVKGFSLSTRIMNMTDDSDGES